jgi:hypothetical protein
MTKLPVGEAWDFVHAIERGEITLTVVPPANMYSGNVGYRASNGWIIVIFSDCGEWDYIDRIEDDACHELDFDDMPKDLADYQPSSEVVTKAYHFRG